MGLSAEEEKTKVEAYTTLADQLHTQYDKRRELEWKIHILLWTLITAVGYLLISQNIGIGKPLYLLFVIVPLHFIWCVKIHTGGFRAQHLSQYYRRKAEELLTPCGPLIDDRGRPDSPDKDLHPPRWLRECFECYWWWIAAEIGTTVLLTTGIVYLVRLKVPH